MNTTKTLSVAALKVINDYQHFQAGSAVSSVPYFNNRTVGAKFAERGRVGKGSPEDIKDELDIILVKNHLDAKALDDASLKKILTDHNLGIDCSALAYYVLEAENTERGHGHLNRRMTFVKGGNPVTKMFSYLRPVQNCDVRTFASDTNSRVVSLKDVQPGDMITMISAPGSQDRNHILIVDEVTYESGLPKSFTYAHSVAYPEDGLYGTGIKHGRIDITLLSEPLIKQSWSESGTPEGGRRILERAIASTTELRRLKWLS